MSVSLTLLVACSAHLPVFSTCARPGEGGGIKRIIMGLDRNNKTPCGFAFVEYYLHSEAVSCMRYISGTKLDERIIRCDLDPGYKEGRQFGRGKSGGQVRDEFRQEYDSGRGTSRMCDRTRLIVHRRVGASTPRGGKETAGTGPFTVTDAIRHIRFGIWRAGYGWRRCTERRGAGDEGQEGQKRGRWRGWSRETRG